MRLTEIDGRHALRRAVPDGFVDYHARSRHGGQVFFFNFDLARHAGLIAADHPAQLTAELEELLLKQFSLQIINEFDIEQGRDFPPDEIRPYPYMATRYLQLQHPGRRGETSGDGRSIWNGSFTANGREWDVSSCGTGVTRLSPATANEGRFFETGDPNACYGSGLADVWDGIGAALMSEILHGNGIATERVLAVIGYDDGSAVNVRTYANLLRPAHFFRYMKQGRLEELRGLLDYYIERQVRNGDWPGYARSGNRYRYFLERITEDFARMAARFEIDYIFCWMDWDGDNILMDGAIIDYGSLRQFGLFHREYRYEDVDRYSTSITEQRNKARYIVQTFVQIIDFVQSGSRKTLRSFKRHPALRRFDRIVETCKDHLVLEKIGFPEILVRRLLNDRQGQLLIRDLRRDYHHFERVVARRGVHRVEDGISRDAVFCIRDILRELPAWLLEHGEPMPAREFIAIMRSRYASRSDVRLYPARQRRIRHFQALYQALVMRAAELSGRVPRELLAEISTRSALINRHDRVTGDSLVYVSQELMNKRRRMPDREWYALFRRFVEQQILVPDYFSPQVTGVASPRARRELRSLQRIVSDYREGL